jgi:hypothetical protein
VGKLKGDWGMVTAARTFAPREKGRRSKMLRARASGSHNASALWKAPHAMCKGAEQGKEPQKDHPWPP